MKMTGEEVGAFDIMLGSHRGQDLIGRGWAGRIPADRMAPGWR